MPDVTLDLGNQYIGSAYSPQVAITETETGHQIDFTFADSEHPGQLTTEGFEVPNYADEEAAREAAEAQRQAYEAQRIAAEDAREAAESSRVSAEHDRRSYEQGRQYAETARQQAEAARSAAESARAGAESNRQSSEQARKDAENARQFAEHDRRAAEELRAEAEQARESAEAAREAAEQARETDTAAAIAVAQAATSAANTAASDAQAASTEAEGAAARADTAADAAMAMVRNVPTGTLTEGMVLTATDAAPAPPIEATVYGTSTQDGTPTPSAPVPIVSVEGDEDGNISLVVQLTSDASVTTTTAIDLDGHELRSLPDGTRDELTVDAEGHVTLVQRVETKSIAASDWTLTSSDRYSIYINPYATGNTPFMNTAYVRDTATYPAANGMRIGASGSQAILGADSTLADSELLYALATPVTHDLGTVALVPLVGPDLTAQTVPTAPFALTYERDVTIVLDRLTAMWGNVAPVESDTASANYGVGSYLIHDGQLCRVTTAIATGEAITIGTNVTATTVMAEILTLTQ